MLDIVTMLLHTDLMHTNKLIQRPGRTVVLVDLENLLTLNPLSCEVAALRGCLEALRDAGCLIELACSHWFAKRFAFDFPFGRSQWRSGKDGADQALLDTVAIEDLSSRFESVVLFSGDGGFADVVGQLAAEGLHITVIARPGSLSGRLRLAAHGHIIIDLNETDTTETEDESDLGDAA